LATLFPPADGTYRDFKDASAVVVGAVSLLSVAATSVVGSIASARSAKSLAAYASDLSVKVEFAKEALQERLASFGNELQRQLQRDIAILQATTLSRQTDAYQQLLEALAGYHGTLAHLEWGDWKRGKEKEVELAMIKARALLPYLESAEHRQTWLEGWQLAVHLCELAGPIVQSSEQQILWRKHAPALGEQIKTFENIVAQRFAGLRKVITT
jgi:predicted nucleotidyltransferase